MMKPHFLHLSKTFFTALFLILLITSCSTDDDGENGSQGGSNSFSAVVNGQSFNPEFITGFATGTPNTILVTGSMGDGEQIQFFIPTTATVGSYTLSNQEVPEVIGYYQKIDGDAFDVTAFATNGSLTIVSHNTTQMTISGTFNFTGAIDNTGETFTITQGEFDITYSDL